VESKDPYTVAPPDCTTLSHRAASSQESWQEYRHANSQGILRYAQNDNSKLLNTRLDPGKEIDCQQGEDREEGSHQRKQMHHPLSLPFPSVGEKEGDPREDNGYKKYFRKKFCRPTAGKLLPTLSDTDNKESRDDSDPTDPPKTRQPLARGPLSFTFGQIAIHAVSPNTEPLLNNATANLRTDADGHLARDASDVSTSRLTTALSPH